MLRKGSQTTSFESFRSSVGLLSGPNDLYMHLIYQLRHVRTS
jgi:hypothetical protein